MNIPQLIIIPTSKSEIYNYLSTLSRKDFILYIEKVISYWKSCDQNNLNVKIALNFCNTLYKGLNDISDEVYNFHLLTDFHSFIY